MKKFLSLLLSLCLLMALSPASFAADGKITLSDDVKEFGIVEQIDSLNRIIRTYTREPYKVKAQPDGVAAEEKTDYSETKQLLLALGMEQVFIDKLSDDALELYATSPHLSGIVSYTKTDKENKVCYVSEEVALAASAAIQRRSENKIAPIVMHMSSMQPMASDTYEDAYMRIFYLVTYTGSGKYLFSTDARWLTMPFFRGIDSIGSCAQNGAVDYRTSSGWYEYNTWHYVYGDIYNTYTKTNMKSGDYRNVINGSWYGSAGLFTLPGDIHSDSFEEVHSNFKAHYEYSGYVNYPGQESWFNTIGSYDHTTFYISLSPSISIDTEGTASASIGLDVWPSTDRRSAKLLIHYTP